MTGRKHAITFRSATAALEGVFRVEDASQAVGSKVGDRYAGAWGDVAVASFAAGTPLGCGQGGMLLTDDDEFATHAFRMKNYGRSALFGKGTWAERGRNAQWSELQAAMAAGLFATIEERIAARHALAVAYKPWLGRGQLQPCAATGWPGRPNPPRLPLHMP